MSHDGRRLARQIEPSQVEVRDVLDGGPALLITGKGGCHNEVEIYLEDSWLAIKAGDYNHFIRWDREKLEAYHGLGRLLRLVDKYLGPSGNLRACEKANSQTLESVWLGEPKRPADTNRYVSAARGGVLALVDRYGQVAILDEDRKLVCMFFAFRNELAAWTPENVRWGKAHLTGGPPTPSGGVKIAKALCEACRKGL